MTAPIIGIDLGTTYSCVGEWNGTDVTIIPNLRGNMTTPSWIAFTDDGERVAGEDAKDFLANNPDSKTVIYDIKRLLGRDFNDEKLQENLEHFPYEVISNEFGEPVVLVGEKRYKPEQLSAMLLEKLKSDAEEFLGKKIKDVVITVPAYFNDSQRSATKNSATIAGLNCIKIINEPTAACLCYGLNKREDGTKVLIFDLGGGTFDVSLLRLDNGIFHVLSTAGDTNLGGEDFDGEIIKYFIEEGLKSGRWKVPPPHSSLKGVAERAKISLSSSNITTMSANGFSCKISRAQFEKLCENYFLRCFSPVEKALKDASLRRDEIDEIILVGGSTRIPKVQALLSEYFGGKQLNKSVHPDHAVAYGAAIQAAIMLDETDNERLGELLLLDVTPLGLGVKTRGDKMSYIIKRNTQYPTKNSSVYTISEDGQSSVLIDIYEGEREFARDNRKIGSFNLKDIPRRTRGDTKIRVCFEIDNNGILKVSAEDIETGISNEVKFTDSKRLSDEEIARMVEEAKIYRAEDELKKEALNAQLTYERYLFDVQKSLNDPELGCNDLGESLLTGEERDWMNVYILNNLSWLQQDGHSKDTIEAATERFKEESKHIMNKIYARYKQLNLRRQTEEREATEEEVKEFVETRF
jgi:molecular chaperone DnaK (HSP70)